MGKPARSREAILRMGTVKESIPVDLMYVTISREIWHAKNEKRTLAKPQSAIIAQQWRNLNPNTGGIDLKGKPTKVAELRKQQLKQKKELKNDGEARKNGTVRQRRSIRV